MRYNTLSGVLKAMIEAHTTFTSNMQKDERALKNIEREIKEKLKDRETSPAERERLNERLSGEYDVYKHHVLKNRKAAMEMLDELRTNFERIAKKRYEIKSEMLECDAVKLLNSGIKLSADELENIIADNKSNIVLARLVDEYAEKNNIKSGRLLRYKEIYSSGGGIEIGKFDVLENIYKKTFGTDEIKARIWAGKYAGMHEIVTAEIDEISAIVGASAE